MRDAAQEQTRVLADQVDQTLASKIAELERLLAQLSQRSPVRRFDFDECAIAFRDIALSLRHQSDTQHRHRTASLQPCVQSAAREPPTKAG